MTTYVIIVTTATTGGGVFFQVGVPFSTQNAKWTAFRKVYSENKNTEYAKQNTKYAKQNTKTQYWTRYSDLVLKIQTSPKRQYMPQTIWYNFAPIRTSGSIVSTLTLHSLIGPRLLCSAFHNFDKPLCGRQKPMQAWTAPNII